MTLSKSYFLYLWLPPLMDYTRILHHKRQLRVEFLFFFLVFLFLILQTLEEDKERPLHPSVKLTYSLQKDITTPSFMPSS